MNLDLRNLNNAICLKIIFFSDPIIKKEGTNAPS
jgi:hypothetical protein